MRRAPSARHATLFALVAAATSLIGGLHAADRLPRTADGRADLQGLWVNDTATPLERPKEVNGRAAFTEAEARAYLERYQLDRTLGISRNKSFELDAAGDLDTYEPGPLLPGRRTSMITDPPDGRIPALVPEAQRVAAERTQQLDQHFADNPEDFPNAERCLLIGNSSAPPMLPVFYNNTVQIVQTRDAVMILSEMIHDVRVVSLTRTSHLPPAVQRWTGDSIGHWDGDVLVVDTTNFTGKTSFRGSGLALHVIERFSRSDTDTLKYEFTVDDPSFVRRWSGDSRMTRTSLPMFEYSCHEANYSLADVLRGARFSEHTK